MRFKYEYKVYEDCLAATEISESREKNKILHSIMNRTSKNGQ